MNSSNTGSGSLYNPFSTGSTSTSGFKDFVDSNSLVAKIAFLLLVLFGFVIALRLGISILAYFLSPTGSPHLIDGMVDGKQMIIFPQDPNTSGAKTITRSVNANDGIEFTWSSWVFIDNLQYNAGKYKHVFHKGNDQVSTTGLNFPNNAPGLYIAPNTNAFVIIMNTYDNINEEITIPDIPMNKWISVIMRCQNKTLDVYINGTIARSVQLAGVPKQNYGDVFVAMNGGFSGYVSNLWYYNYALGTAAIQNIVHSGPNTKMVGSNAMNMKNPNYLSLRWFFYGTQDQFNP
jgi:hypothetical protein|uniref:Lectin/glucanase superfamily protein n=1 Tax=viral metagenome TaxID=1070528 RepID=A0A6C0DU63_9ZZZZ